MGERNVAFSGNLFPKRQHKQGIYALVKTLRCVETKELLRMLS